MAVAKQVVECLIVGCDREAVSRGVCHSCYASARNAIKKQATSWAELEKLGLVGPPLVAKSKFAAALQVARSKKK